MPLMFRRKDIVHLIGTELYGIVDGTINDEDELQYRNCAKNGDYSDWQITVNLIYDGKSSCRYSVMIISHRQTWNMQNSKMVTYAKECWNTW